MHPLTVYESSVRERAHQLKERTLEHEVQLRRRERGARVPTSRGNRPTSATAAHRATARDTGVPRTAGAGAGEHRSAPAGAGDHRPADAALHDRHPVAA